MLRESQTEPLPDQGMATACVSEPLSFAALDFPFRAGHLDKSKWPRLHPISGQHISRGHTAIAPISSPSAFVKPGASEQPLPR